MQCDARRCPATVGFKDGVAEFQLEVQPERVPERRVPQSLEEVDNGQIMGFGADLAEDHPGFRDQAYKDRRRDIGNVARAHRVGEPIPRLEYTAEELHVWATVLRELKDLYPQHACAEFLRCLPLFNFHEHEVPQLEHLSQILKRETGWQIRPVAGLLHPRDFLNGLAFKTFHSTQYIRHPSKPMYTPEPDVCHELLGHVPMLADQAFCDMVHSIGVASLCADDKQIWHLTKIYWFTVEFGVVEEGDEIKAFGAGILSSFGEMEHMHTGRAKLLPFDPEAKQPKMSYKDGYQKQYYVLKSFAKGAQQLRDYCAKITPPEVMAKFMKPAA
ncbi:g3858 [Coccomyxa viridis]|uniref:phenylalanine 4-monooxygenase n=1 Tax=Coccomyxa viridis TaxID=1274662 RepID=A0ABP1FNV4_9CHLO